MNLSDISLLVRKIVVGILITFIPFLIIWGGLQLIPKALKSNDPQPKSSIQPKNK